MHCILEASSNINRKIDMRLNTIERKMRMLLGDGTANHTIGGVQYQSTRLENTLSDSSKCLFGKVSAMDGMDSKVKRSLS